MQTSAQKMHETLRKELNAYIMSQYFGKNLLLQRAIEPHLDEEGRLYREPYIESTPAYHSTPNGIQTLNTEPWLKDFFGRLSRDGLGVYASPFEHQLHALQGALDGQDMLVSTGTGSGKTECFMWPMIAKLCTEAKTQPGNWQIRGVRTIVMYPMNALVADQLSRLRRLIGDPEGKFVRAFRDTAGISSRRPQFGMYTGRTAYPGKEPNSSEDRRLAASLSSMICPSDDENVELYTELLRDGKIPAKRDLTQFVAHLKNNKHITDPEDAELITRFEMQKTCPDILITNYSMLEYMLLRPQEAEIWEQTKEWLNLSKQNKLLFVIDEAHMYRGSSGGEVALLLRRLFHKLGIGRDKVQFILTTASIPYSTDQERAAVHRFTNAPYLAS